MITNLEKTGLLGKKVDYSLLNKESVSDDEYCIVVHEVSEHYVILRKETFCVHDDDDDSCCDDDASWYEDIKLTWEKFSEEYKLISIED